jgi:hypothetical protein
MDFDEWIQYGINNGFCSEQFCMIHAGVPTSELEDQIQSRDDWDPDDLCVHTIRLGSTKDWDLDAESWIIDQLESR